MTWVLRYRINGKEQTPLIVGLVSDFPHEDEANVEADRLGLRVRINCTNPKPEAREVQSSLRNITSRSNSILR